jgi:hypothetical protein
MTIREVAAPSALRLADVSAGPHDQVDLDSEYRQSPREVRAISPSASVLHNPRRLCALP